MLYKTIALSLSTLLFATAQISTASAGCGGGHAYSGKQAFHQSRPSKARLAAKQSRKAVVKQAKVEKATPAAETKTAAAGKDGPENELSVAAVDQTCTKFIAETGTTVQVECTKQ